MNYLLGAVVCASLPLGEAAAQQVILPLKKEFLDSTWHVLPSAVGAAYWRETTLSADSTSSSINSYYLSGQLQEHMESRLLQKGRHAGFSKKFDEASRLVSYKEFDESKGSWEWKLYYPNGQLKRREHNGWPKHNRQCFAPDGSPIPFFAYQIAPRYPEGNGSMEVVIQAIKRLASYPDDARQQRAEGRVFVAFTVTKQGSVTNVQTVRSFLPSVGTAVTQAVRQLKPFTPAQLDGCPVDKRIILPIDFHLP
jgi:protein TonB